MARLSVLLHRIVTPAADLRTEYDVHQLLWRAFPNVARETPRPFLYRADRQLIGGEQRLMALVQSPREPDWSTIPCFETERAERVFEVGTGALFRFFLRANPTRSRKGQHAPHTRSMTAEKFRATRGQRVAITRNDEREHWLERAADRCGFRIVHPRRYAGGMELATPALRISNAHTIWWARGANRARHDGVDFEGVLEVTSPEKLMAAVRSGIGPAKAFGYGLLSLRAAV